DPHRPERSRRARPPARGPKPPLCRLRLRPDQCSGGGQLGAWVLNPVAPGRALLALSLTLALLAVGGPARAATGERYFPETGQTGPPTTPPSSNNPRFFPETKHTIGGRFRAYWESHGGLEQQGYPISEEFEEISALDHLPYRVQYFQRAVFEYHPEYAGTPYE